mgnify:CR=1 FL=1
MESDKNEKETEVDWIVMSRVLNRINEDMKEESTCVKSQF